MNINLINKSSIPTAKLLKIISFCRPKNCKLPKIIVKDLKDKNKAYDCDFRYSIRNQIEPWVVIRINSPDYFPLDYQMRADKIKRFGYLGHYKIENQTEAIIFTLAHELHHHYTFKNPKTRYLFVAKIQKTEELADKFAFRKLKKFRELKGKI